MTRKDTVWGARHILEEEEIQRIIQYYQEELAIRITKLEASAIQAVRSSELIWNRQKAKKLISNLRGII